MEQDITQSELNEMATNMKDVADGYDDAMAAIRARGLAAEVVSPQTEDTAMNAIDAAEIHAAEAESKAERPHMREVKRYVPRILQDDGMIPFAEVAHYTHMNRIQYVSVADHDAALRRAKAEGAKEASKIARRRSETVAPVSKRWELNMINKTKCEEAASIADELDARAAQIEEGE